MLPAEVADQIAAGEVVERPASAVKELIENALDAGATAVTVEVTDGGRGTIRVSDDGCGMERADAMLALQRHATSKIRRAEDLVGVQSFGFRGEALPAIASVSYLTMETAPDGGRGTRVTVAGGAVTTVEECVRRQGTTVEVSQLFYNVPARLKFMRGTRSEWRAVADAVTAVALSRRDVHVRLIHDKKPALDLAAAASFRARIGAVWGAPYAESLLTVGDTIGTIRVSGLVERPSDVGTRSRRIHLAIRGRAVRDGGLVRAAEAAYRSTIPAGVRPSLFLELDLPADAVDVNVHPAKAEVRLRDRWPVERAVETAVRHALGVLASAAPLAARVFVSGGSGGLMRMGLSSIGAERDAVDASDRSGAGASDGNVDADWWASMGVDSGPLFSPGSSRAGIGHAPDDGGRALGSGLEDAVGGDSHRVQPLAGEIASLRQVRRAYILLESPQGLVFIDQHSAHERVLYEQFMGAFDRGQLASQHLLFPITVHVGAAAADAFDAHRDLFARLGFEMDGFGGQTLVVHGVPAPHPRFDAERCLRETLDALTGDRAPGTAARHEHLAATVACKAAIKAGDELSQGEMRALVLALARTTLPAHDVHGRSTVVRLSWDDLERRFGRR